METQGEASSGESLKDFYVILGDYTRLHGSVLL